ncbi:MAG: RdgB/HAM1 family non-canonical purine NTP pyrophosphatase [Paludibacteraceae bacterium]|nr:RdgB/HAM1 family non-canonical purine NTP pyrophosphatase [Paludibacteraceae bacterium]
MRLVFASNNDHKLSEVRQIMPPSVEVLSLRDIGFEAEIDETGSTLEANSRIKAETVSDWISGKRSSLSDIDGVFADDTGLEIDALHGAPGVYTARWAGEPVANRAKALRELDGNENRGCQFRTVITLIRFSADGGQPSVSQVEGVVRGRIATAEYGEGGFGYDPLFIPEGYDRTFAELPASVKNSISHRARALKELVKLL